MNDVLKQVEEALVMHQLHLKHHHVTYLGFGYDAERQEQFAAREYVMSDKTDSALTALRGLEWKPIESAPRTRQYILAYSPERKMSFQVCWDHEWGYWQMIGGGKCTMEFTHWSPLPAPPQEVECEA